MLYRSQFSAADCINKLNELKSMTSQSALGETGVQVNEVDGDSFTLTLVSEHFGRKMPMLRYKCQVSDAPESDGSQITGVSELASGFKTMLYGVAAVFLLPSLITMLITQTTSLGPTFAKYHVNFIIMLVVLGLLSPSLLRITKNSGTRINSFFETELAAECLDKQV